MLDNDTKREAEGILKMKVNMKLLQQHLSMTSQKVVTLKDISNIHTAVNKSTAGNDLETLVKKLREMPGKPTLYSNTLIFVIVIN